MRGAMSLWKLMTKTPVVKQEVRRGSFVWGRDGFTWVGDKETSSVTSSVTSAPTLTPTSNINGEEETEPNNEIISEPKYQT